MGSTVAGAGNALLVWKQFQPLPFHQVARRYNLEIASVKSCNLAQAQTLGKSHHTGVNCLQSQRRIGLQQFRHSSVIVGRDFYDQDGTTSQDQFSRRNLVHRT